MENQVHFEILQVATTQKLQRFTVNRCVVICGYSAVLQVVFAKKQHLLCSFSLILATYLTITDSVVKTFQLTA